MGISWSAMRKVLEQENICESLKGRIQYFATRYRKSHDQEGRVAIRLDGEEILKSDFYDWSIKRREAWEEINLYKGRKTSYAESGELIELGALNKGGFDQFSFYDAFHRYRNSSIDDSLVSPDPVVRLFAILDKRAGKERLRKISDIEQQPEWLQTVEYESGAGVDEGGSMHGKDIDCALVMRFESQLFYKQLDKKSLELRFLGLRRLNLAGYEENHFCEISSCYLSFYRDYFVWSDDECFNPESYKDTNLLDEPACTLVVTKRLEWRFI